MNTIHENDRTLQTQQTRKFAHQRFRFLPGTIYHIYLRYKIHSISSNITLNEIYRSYIDVLIKPHMPLISNISALLRLPPKFTHIRITAIYS